MLARLAAACINNAFYQHSAVAFFIRFITTRGADDDLTVFYANALRFQHAFRNNQAVDDVLTCRCGQRDGSAIGFNQPAIGHQLGFYIIRHSHLHQPIAIEIHCRGIAGSQLHAAQLGANHPVIHHIRRNQPHQSSFLGGDGAFVRNRRIRLTFFVKGQCVVIHEFVVINIGRGGDEAIYIHLCAAPKHHAVLVHNHHITIGGEFAVDITRAVAVHAVQRNGLAVWLMKLRMFIRRNVKPAPVYHRLVALLMDIKFLTDFRNRCLPSGHGSTLRICRCCKRHTQPCGC